MTEPTDTFPEVTEQPEPKPKRQAKPKATPVIKFCSFEDIHGNTRRFPLSALGLSKNRFGDSAFSLYTGETLGRITPEEAEAIEAQF